MRLHYTNWKNRLKMRLHQTKNSFHQKEYLRNRKKTSSTSQKISFHKQELLPLNFKGFNKALKKKILFPLDRKSVSTSRNEEFVQKRFHLTENMFSQPGISDQWKKLFFTSQKNSFYQEQKLFDNGFHQQKPLNKRILFHLVKKGFCSFCFC